MGLYCSKHKRDEMIDVKNKTCLECKKQPYFNFEGQITGLYCADHKRDGMINVVSKTCLECRKIPAFNFEGRITGLYCTNHKRDGMINVKNKTCLECKKQPMFNFEGQITRLYCADHKRDGMIDVKNKTCLECKKQPYFNFEGQITGLYCANHKRDGMIDVKNKTCLECKKRPTFNFEGQITGLYCADHKRDGMINVVSKTCKSNWCLTYVGNKYNGYCLHCYMHLFPDKPVSRNYKTKEYAVVEHVKNKFPDQPWIADRIISGGCSRRRPDLLLDLLYQVIVIEIDENQHADYDCSCENKRIMELSQDLGHRPLVFIRFNPDDYRKDDKNMTSCWSINKNGICAIKKTKVKEWEQRLRSLEEQIVYWTNPENTTDKTVEIVQLYYDSTT